MVKTPNVGHAANSVVEYDRSRQQGLVPDREGCHRQDRRHDSNYSTAEAPLF